MRELLKEYDEACFRSEAQPSSRRSGGSHRNGFAGSVHSHSQKARSVVSQAVSGYGDGLEPQDLAPESTGSGRESRHTGRSYRSSLDTGRRNQTGKPFVVCSSSRSHHTAAQAHHRSRRVPQSLPEDSRLFAKAALRYAKNPADAQALGKLASLLKSGAGQTVDARLPEPSIAAETNQDCYRPTHDVPVGTVPSATWPSRIPAASTAPASDESLRVGAMQPEPRRAARSTSPNTAARLADPRVSPMHASSASELSTQRLLMQLGKVRGVQAAWPPGTSPARGWGAPEWRV